MRSYYYIRNVMINYYVNTSHKKHLFCYSIDQATKYESENDALKVIKEIKSIATNKHIELEIMKVYK